MAAHLGITVDGGLGSKELFLTAGKGNSDAVSSCINDAFTTEYPGREGITIQIPPEVVDDSPGGP